MDNIKITVRDTEQNEATFIVPPDAEITDFVHLLRTVLYWLTFDPETIDEFLPDPEREWSYAKTANEPDEERPDET